MRSASKTVPERTCAGCGLKAPQPALLRIASLQGAPPRIDAAQKAPGRGVYVCKNQKCVEIALKKRALGRTLKLKNNITAAFEAELRRFTEGER